MHTHEESRSSYKLASSPMAAEAVERREVVSAAITSPIHCTPNIECKGVLSAGVHRQSQWAVTESVNA